VGRRGNYETRVKGTAPNQGSAGRWPLSAKTGANDSTARTGAGPAPGTAVAAVWKEKLNLRRRRPRAITSSHLGVFEATPYDRHGPTPCSERAAWSAAAAQIARGSPAATKGGTSPSAPHSKPSFGAREVSPSPRGKSSSSPKHDAQAVLENEGTGRPVGGRAPWLHTRGRPAGKKTRHGPTISCAERLVRRLSRRTAHGGLGRLHGNQPVG